MGVVIDTSLLIADERGRFSVKKFLENECAGKRTFITTMTVSELLHGWERASEGKRKVERKARIDATFEKFEILDFDFEAAKIHARLWADLQSRGQIINPNDIIIAACAVAGGHDIGTLNRKDFERIPGLILKDVSPYEISIS